jgi:hypothetical protein
MALERASLLGGIIQARRCLLCSSNVSIDGLIPKAVPEPGYGSPADPMMRGEMKQCPRCKFARFMGGNVRRGWAMR